MTTKPRSKSSRATDSDAKATKPAAAKRKSSAGKQASPGAATATRTTGAAKKRKPTADESTAAAEPTARKPVAILTPRALRSPGQAAPVAVPSRFADFAARAPVSAWADARRAVTITGDSAPQPVALKLPRGAEITGVTLGDDGTRLGVRVTTPEQGSRIHVFAPDGTGTVHENCVAVSFGPDGDLHLARPKELVHLSRVGDPLGEPRPTGGYLAAQLRSDGAACFPSYGQLRVLLPDGRALALAAGSGPVAAVRMHPTLPLVAGQWVEEGVLRVFAWDDCRVLLEIAAPWCRGVMSLAFAPDGQAIAAIGPGVNVYSLTTGAQVLALPGGREMTGGFVDATTLQIGAGLRSTHSLGAPAELGASVFSLALAGGDRLVLERGGAVELGSIASGERTTTLPVTGAQRVAFARDGAIVMATTGEATLAFDTATGAELFRRPHVGEAAADLAVAPDGASFVVADATLTRVDLDGWRLTTLASADTGFAAVAWSGTTITARRGDIVVAIDADSGALIAEMTPGRDAGPVVATAVVGESLLAATDTALFAAPLAGGSQRGKLVRSDLAGPVVPSRDGRRLFVLVTRGEATEAQLLDPSLSAIARFPADDVTAAAFDPAGARLVFSRDGQLELVDLP
ncbi:hypothetical protein OV203_30070 [Nannocystis sp. ILAH1]|uniref:WD40 repeat domain-containing protein n=1 Tax=Nannocystis sp. ILAH1 TaxID=2996789 RepID=UPI0022719489|nr:hypothetical protein [Nannocystis sp. ILAH1]MCY0991431.1 hypothetical protein [Nannocystis sp. ILAH1]